MSSYQYRCTEQQLEAHLAKIADAGDRVEHIIYKGGRDYTLICRKGEPTVADLTAAELEKVITAGVVAALAVTERRTAQRVRMGR